MLSKFRSRLIFELMKNFDSFIFEKVLSKTHSSHFKESVKIESRSG